MQPAFVYVIPMLFGVSVFLFALSLIPSKSALSSQLDAIRPRDAFERDTNQLEPFARIFPGDRRANMARRLAEAGWYTVTPAKMGLRVVAGACFGLVLGLLVLNFFHTERLLVIAVAVLVVVCGAQAPLFLLNQAADARKAAILKALPDFLDMLCSTVQAGLALNAALAYAVDVAPGPLGQEIKEALSEIRLGRARAEALRAAAERTNQLDFKNAMRAITQAERLGSNVTKVLTDLADDARHLRVMLVEEMAAKMPVKMVFPMAFFMIPSIFVIIFGALAANYFAPKP